MRSLFSSIYLIFALGVVDAAAVNFNRDVRPILSDRCFHCHGPDEHERKGKLRLDQADGKEGAYRIHNGVPAIKPGVPEESALWHRITTDDADDVMPPADSHKKALTAIEKQLIAQWIREGAEYDTFWAFKKPTRITAAGSSIDHYVAARLKAEKLAPSPPADKRTLLRRLSFDLTGLPPTLYELADFLADSAPNAYERRVDALLARPQYGEHMTRYWADLVRLADTNGLHTDRFRDFSSYREWVIRAFNANMPFNQFIRDQLAGDLYEAPSVGQQIASGFNRLNLMFERGSVLPEESLYRNVLDRVEAVGTAFLGLTVQCAQCHDHKYDPISQREFFQLYAFFNNFSGAAQTGPAEPKGIQEPSIQIVTPEQTAKLSALDEQLRKQRARTAISPKPGRLPATAPRHRWAALDVAANGHVDGGNIAISATAAGGQATVSMWLQPSSLAADNRIFGQLSGASSQAGVVRVLAKGALEVWSGSTWLPLAPAGALSVGAWHHLALVWSKNSVTAYLNALALQTATASFNFGAKNGNFGIGAPFLKQHGSRFPGKINQVAIFNTALSPSDIAGLAGDPDTAAIREQLATISSINQERQKLLSQAGQRAMVMRERNPVREARIRIRGAYDQFGDAVQRGTPAFLPPLQVAGDLPSRMDLANWLVSPEHPLTARVTVNRLWQQLFGVGLVKTSEDFGAQGEWPSHPALLDYLAVRFVESGWNVKALLREIVLSATYKQQSDAPPVAYQADPENRLLARGSRYRIDAEMIRDQMLMLSGQLNTKLYGKSVKPPQPPGLWKSVTMTNELFKADSDPAIYRRSLYTFWKRVMPPPQMSIMNAPSREYCVARRERTNTPLQALVLMNEPEYFKLARACAERTLREVRNDPDQALPRLYERITSQRANAEELATLQESLAELKRHYHDRPDFAWTMIAHSLLNLEATKVRR
ncbi:MAG: hypothetical protein ACI8W8_002289 [Rhodothermales bacterium]|jgi:hypothetical protein